jgi:hypothetical protein
VLSRKVSHALVGRAQRVMATARDGRATPLSPLRSHRARQRQQFHGARLSYGSTSRTPLSPKPSRNPRQPGQRSPTQSYDPGARHQGKHPQPARRQRRPRTGHIRSPAIRALRSMSDCDQSGVTRPSTNRSSAMTPRRSAPPCCVRSTIPVVLSASFVIDSIPLSDSSYCR